DKSVDDGNNDIQPTESGQALRRSALKSLFQLGSSQIWPDCWPVSRLERPWFLTAKDILNKPPMWHKSDAYRHHWDDNRFWLAGAGLGHCLQTDVYRLPVPGLSLLRNRYAIHHQTIPELHIHRHDQKADCQCHEQGKQPE